jgi:hypothetical protein
VCDKFGQKAVDCNELCLLCVNTGDGNDIIAGPQWKDRPHYIIAQEYLPDFDDVTTIDHPQIALIHLKSLANENEKDKSLKLKRVRSLSIKGSLNELREKATASKIDNVARIPAPDPREITVVDEEWFERSHKLRQGHQVWKF